ncbi:MAG: TrkH family potassium uptake protein [bacterium]
MDYLYLLRSSGGLLLVNAGLLLFPAICSLIYEGSDFAAFAWTILGSLMVGGPIYFAIRHSHQGRIRENFVLVALGWVLLTAVGAIPFMIHGGIPSFTDAFFEVMSGYTTTGSTLLTDIEALPHGLLFWRSMTHFVGGMGMIVLYLTLFSSSGANHMYRAEAAPGQGLNGVKMVPRLNETLRWLWAIYLGLNLIQTLLLWFGGMDLFDSLVHAFATISTGGYSNRNASFGHYQSMFLDWVVIVFMFLGGMDFVLHYHLIRRNWYEVRVNTEIKAYLLIVILLGLGVSLILWADQTYSSLADSARFGFFHVVSLITTTGFGTADYEQWSQSAQMLLMITLFIGGCTGSTSSGIRIIHVVIILKSISHTAKTMLQPMAVHPLRINGRPLAPPIVHGIMSFFTLNILGLLVGSVVLTLFDPIDFWSAFSAMMATLWNIGPAFGAVGPTQNFAQFSDISTWVLSFSMLAGRLDIYTLLVFFFPGFWKN